MTYLIVETAEEKRVTETIERCAERLAANVLRLLDESLAGRVSCSAALKGCRVPWWVWEWGGDNRLNYATYELVKSKAIASDDDLTCDWIAIGGLHKTFQKRFEATRPVLDELFSGDWNGIKDGTVRRRVRKHHGRRIEDCDWWYFQGLFIGKQYPATLWQGSWYTAEGLAVAQGKAGAALLVGERSEIGAVLTPYLGMTRREGYAYLEWAWDQHDNSADTWEKIAPDALLDERLLGLGRMLLASGRGLAWLVHEFCGCREDPTQCWMVPYYELWPRATRIDSIWCQLPGYKGADLADI
jgi:hypothetical protein